MVIVRSKALRRVLRECWSGQSKDGSGSSEGGLVCRRWSLPRLDEFDRPMPQLTRWRFGAIVAGPDHEPRPRSGLPGRSPLDRQSPGRPPCGASEKYSRSPGLPDRARTDVNVYAFAAFREPRRGELATAGPRVPRTMVEASIWPFPRRLDGFVLSVRGIMTIRCLTSALVAAVAVVFAISRRISATRVADGDLGHLKAT